MRNKKDKIDFWNVSLYNLLWRKNLFTKIIYVLIPFILIGVLLLILQNRDAFEVRDNFYAFQFDYTNCYMLCYIFFFIYFVHGLFLPYLEKQVDFLRKKTDLRSDEKHIRAYRKWKRAVTVTAICISFFAALFIYCANSAGEANWYNNLNTIEFLYYSVIIFSSWYVSARFFLTIIVESIAVYIYSKRSIRRLDFYNPDKKGGFRGLFTSLVASMGFGVYFLIAIGMIIYSDFRAYERFKIELLVYKHWSFFCVITVALAAVYYTVVILAYLSLNSRFNDIISNKIQQLDINDGKRKYLEKTALPIVSINDVFVFLLSVMFPGIAAIIQIFSPFGY